MKWVDTLERKIRRFAIPNLMNYLVFGMGLVYVADMMGFGLSRHLALWMPLVQQGQVWRLITFVFMPINSSPIWVIFSLYFYWLIGRSLEHQWGSARFMLFYLVGIIGNIIAALITGYASNTFLNLSLFLAFAATYPDYEMLIFFILPVKMKWLAILDLALFAYQLIVGNWSTRAAILLSMLSVVLFIGGDFLDYLRRDSRYWKTRRNFRKAMKK